MSEAHDGRNDRLRPAQPAGVPVRGGACIRVAKPIGRNNRRSSARLDFALADRRFWPLGRLFHLFFPDVAAADIGWEPSPFQLEVGMADLAMGATACVSFWRSLDFKAAVVIINAIFLLGDAIGHVGQMIAAGDFAPGNVGVPFFGDIAFPVLALILLIIVQRSEAAPRLS
jgi:hypothetical protein